MKLTFKHLTGGLMLLVFSISTGTSKAQTLDIKQMPATAVRQQGSFFQYAVYINEDKPESDEGAMDAVKSVWLANERVGTVEKVCVTNPQAPAVWQQMNTPEANAVDVPITNIAAADKAWVVITDMTKVIVEGCPDGRNIYTYIIDTENHTAKQFPSTEGFIKAHWDKKEIVLGFYGYDDSGRYSYKRIYSLDGRFIRNTGEIERE